MNVEIFKKATNDPEIYTERGKKKKRKTLYSDKDHLQKWRNSNLE